jgi:hypothetical protein
VKKQKGKSRTRTRVLGKNQDGRKPNQEWRNSPEIENKWEPTKERKKRINGNWRNNNLCIRIKKRSEATRKKEYRGLPGRKKTSGAKIRENPSSMDNPVRTITWSEASTKGINKYIRSNQPVKINEIPSTFKPVEWSLDEIEKMYGEKEVRVLKSENQYFKYDDKKERTIEKMKLKEFIRKGIKEPGEDGYYYALGRSPIDQFEELRTQMDLPNAISSAVNGFMRMPEKNLWISTKGTRTALHFDAVENLNLQIEGAKEFLLFPPKISNMYAYPITSQAAYVSAVDPRLKSEIPNDFPIGNATNVKLLKGEMIYIPYGWWHQVDTVGAKNVNANYWWFPRIKLVTFPRQTVRGAMVLINRKGKHPHKRAEKIQNKE